MATNLRVPWIVHLMPGDQYRVENPLRAAALNHMETWPVLNVSSEPLPTMALSADLWKAMLLLSTASQLSSTWVPLVLRPQVKWTFGAGLLGISLTSGALCSLSCSKSTGID